MGYYNVFIYIFRDGWFMSRFFKKFFFEIKDLYAHTVTLFFWSEKLGCEYLIFKI